MPLTNAIYSHTVMCLRLHSLRQQRKRKSLAVRRVLSVRELVNQAVGDAFSDVLLTEAILRLKGWGIQEWDALYTDLPSRQVIKSDSEFAHFLLRGCYR